MYSYRTRAHPLETRPPTFIPRVYQDVYTRKDTRLEVRAAAHQRCYAGFDITLRPCSSWSPDLKKKGSRASRLLHLLRLYPVPSSLDLLPYRHRPYVQGICCVQRPKSTLSNDDARRIPDAEAHHSGSDVLLHRSTWREAIAAYTVSQIAEGLAESLFQIVVGNHCGSHTGKLRSLITLS